ncbi:MAG: helix-turn-helix domain-containing protein [Flavobacteriales bacterium]|nr:helix-turn-helix domain-containing protein [Flavobacteriales bacterium]
MNSYIEKYKGIHPGIVLERELKKRMIAKRPFAQAIGEHPQTLNAITKGKRKLNIPLALKIEKNLGFEEGTFVLLQTYFDIMVINQSLENQRPNLDIIRKSLFWDTDILKIDWQKHYKSVIRRIFERGNDQEKQEITTFYGAEKVNSVLMSQTGKPYTIYQNC